MTGSTPHVVHVTSFHPPEDARIHWRECASTAAAGFRVSLVARAPEPATVAPGVTVVPFPEIDGGRVKRASLGAARAISAAVRLSPDIIHLHDPELVLALPYLKTRTSAKIVLDLHEDLALQIQHKPWIPTPVSRVLSPAVRTALRATRPFVDLYVVAWPHPVSTTPANRTIEVHNYPFEAEFGDTHLAAGDFRSRDNVVLSLGSITEPRAFVEILQTAELVGDRARFVVAGAMRPSTLAGTHAELIERSGVELPGHLDREGVANVLRQARIGLCLLHPTPQYRIAEPTKVFEYLQAGLPIIGCDFGPTKEIIDSYSCGITVDPTNPAAVAEAVRHLLDHPEEAEAMSRNASAIGPRFVWEREAERLVGAYRSLLATTHR